MAEQYTKHHHLKFLMECQPGQMITITRREAEAIIAEYEEATGQVVDHTIGYDMRVEE